MRGNPPTGPSARAPRIAGLVAGGLSLLLYVCTTHQVVDRDDVAEFQTLAATGGIAHSGYPVPVIALQLLGHLPFSTMAFRANLLSAMSAAVAVGLAAYAAVRLGARPMAAVTAALALAAGITMWEEATHAEVYAFTLAIAAIIFLVAMRFSRHPDARGGLALGVLGGLGLLSHLTVLGLFPLVVSTTLQAARTGHLRARHLAIGVAGLLLGLTPFGYMLAHDRPDQPMNYIHDTLRPDNLRELSGDHPPTTRLARSMWLLSARQFLGGYSYAPFADVPGRVGSLFAGAVTNEFPLWGVPLAAFGFYLMVRRRLPWWPGLALWLAGTLFLLLYAAGLPVVRMFFIPGLWILSLGIAVALDHLADRSRALFVAACAMLLLTPLVRLAIVEPPGPIARYGMLSSVWRIAPSSWNPFAPDSTWDAYGRAVMGALPPRAVVLSCWEEATTLRYFRYGEPLRDDVDILYHCLVPAPAFAAADSARRPVFTTYEPATAMTGGRPFHAVGRWPRGGLWRIESPEAH